MVDYREQYQSENGEWIMIDPRNPGFILKRRSKMWKTLRFTPEYLGKVMKEISVQSRVDKSGPL